MNRMPAAGARGRRGDGRRELRILDKRAIILAFRRNKRYFVQVGCRIPAPEGVEKRSLRAVKIELEEVDDA
jgi:hypothetical protein